MRASLVLRIYGTSTLGNGKTPRTVAKREVKLVKQATAAQCTERQRWFLQQAWSLLLYGSQLLVSHNVRLNPELNLLRYTAVPWHALVDEFSGIPDTQLLPEPLGSSLDTANRYR